MIVVNRNWLLHIGMPAEVIAALEETRGLMLSELDAFAVGMTGGRYTSQLVREQHPRTLLLLGLRDKHGAASGMGATIELGISGTELRMLSASEQRTALDALSAIDTPTARAVAAAIHEAPCG